MRDFWGGEGGWRSKPCDDSETHSGIIEKWLDEERGDGGKLKVGSLVPNSILDRHEGG